MPVFDQKKASEDIILWLAVIGFLVILFFVGKTIARTPPLLVAVSAITPIIGFVWSKFNIALFDEDEMKNVAVAMLTISFFCSIFIGANNGKVESYFSNLFIKGKIVEYQQFVEAEEIYEGRKTIPTHYEKAFRFEPTNKGDWGVDAIEYTMYFICFGIPIINYQVLRYASKKTDKKKEKKNRVINRYNG